MTRLLAIDLGANRVGLAVGEPAFGTVRPLATIRRSTPGRERATLAVLVDEQSITELVVGLPLNMDGSEGPQARLTRAWAQDVLEPLHLPVCFRDERLTTERAAVRIGGPRRGSGGGPPSPARRSAHRSRLDRQAAALILEAELAARRAAAGHR